MEVLNHQDRLVLEAIIPAHMMFLTYEAMTRKGWVIRADVLKALNTACAAPFSQLTVQTDWIVQHIAKRSDDVAKLLLRHINEDDERWGLLDCAAFAITLGTEKLLEPDSQSILVALGLMEECREDEETWGYSEKKAYERGKTMLHRAQLEGYFKPLPKGIILPFPKKL